jgi:hypothetical protein
MIRALCYAAAAAALTFAALELGRLVVLEHRVARAERERVRECWERYPAGTLERWTCGRAGPAR